MARAFAQDWQAGAALELTAAANLALADAEPGASAQPATHRSDPLSPREREVAALIARGPAGASDTG